MNEHSELEIDSRFFWANHFGYINVSPVVLDFHGVHVSDSFKHFNWFDCLFNINFFFFFHFTCFRILIKEQILISCKTTNQFWEKKSKSICNSLWKASLSSSSFLYFFFISSKDFWFFSSKKRSSLLNSAFERKVVTFLIYDEMKRKLN